MTPPDPIKPRLRTMDEDFNNLDDMDLMTRR